MPIAYLEADVGRDIEAESCLLRLSQLKGNELASLKQLRACTKPARPRRRSVCLQKRLPVGWPPSGLPGKLSLLWWEGRDCPFSGRSRAAKAILTAIWPLIRHLASLAKDYPWELDEVMDTEHNKIPAYDFFKKGNKY